MKPETYIKRAVKRLKKNTRRTKQNEALSVPFHGGTYLLGADGVRAHMVQGDYPFDNNPEEIDLTYPANNLMAVFERGRSAPLIATFTPEHVAKVCKAADAIYLDNSQKTRKHLDKPAMRVTLNGAMDFLAFRPENGSMQATLEDGFQWKTKSKPKKFNYHFEAEEPITFWINPLFLKDALAGIKTDVGLKYDSERQMVHIGDEFYEHEAVVMCLLAKPFENDLENYLKKLRENGENGDE